MEVNRFVQIRLILEEKLDDDPLSRARATYHKEFF